MTEENNSLPISLKTDQTRKILLIGIFLILLVLWLINTPPGLLGKLDAVGYAVCHRIPSHSFYFGDRPFSLCARCTGQYLGFLFGMGLHFFRAKKQAGFPIRPILILYGLLFLLYIVDGVNSVLHLYPGLENWSIYEPINSLRLFSGLGIGIVLSGVLYPLLGQSIWREVSLRPALYGLMDWGMLFGGSTFLGLLILSQNPIILYPLILLSTAGLLFLVSLMYTMIWIILTKKENSFTSWWDLRWWWIAGSSSALLQIIAVDWLRFHLTGTWSGFLVY
jgi:uncharacterized membrane protein